MATTFIWDGTSNSWASDHWGRGGATPAYPGDTGSGETDIIKILTGSSPTDGPSGAVVCANYECAITYSNGGNITADVVKISANSTFTGAATYIDAYETAVVDCTATTAKCFGQSKLGVNANITNLHWASSNSDIDGNGAITNLYIYAPELSSSRWASIGTVYLQGPEALIVIGSTTISFPSTFFAANEVKAGSKLGELYNYEGVLQVPALFTGTGVSSLLPFPTSTTSIGPFHVGTTNVGPHPVR